MLAARSQFGLEVAYLLERRAGFTVEGLKRQDRPRGPRWRDREGQPGDSAHRIWQRSRWLRDSLRHIDGLLADHGNARSGSVVQVKHTSTSALLRIPTRFGPVWFKQVPCVFRIEGPLTAWLHAAFPGRVPPVLAAGDGWLLTAEVGASSTLPDEPPLGELAELQIRSIGHVDALRRLGCPTRGLDDLPAAIAELEGWLRRRALPEAALLADHAPHLERLRVRLAELGMPETLVHGDLHPGNAIHTNSGWVLLDWTDASLAHPLVDLTMALRGADTRQTLQPFLQRWAGVVAPGDSAKALKWVPPLGALHQALTHARVAASGGGVTWSRGARAWVRRALELRSD